MKSSYLVLLLYIGLCACCAPVPDTSYEGSDNYTDYELETRISGGIVYPNLKKHRHQVAIFVRTPVGYKFQCGGSIYDRLNVITAAQCLFDDRNVFDTANIKILPGHASLQDIDYLDEFYEVYGYCIHRSYDPDKGSGDIAVIRLKKRLEYNDNVHSLEITHSVRSLIGGDFSGYGSDEQKLKNQRFKPNPDGWYKFRVATVQIMTRDECLKKTDEIQKKDLLTKDADLTKYPDPFKPSDKVACGHSTRVDACDRDVGGPLVCGNKEPYLCGIISSGYGCHMGYPRFYTEIYHYAKWIKEIANFFNKCDAIFVQTPAPPIQYYSDSERGNSGCHHVSFNRASPTACWKYCGSGNTWCWTKDDGKNYFKFCDTEFDCSESLRCSSSCGLI